MHNIKVSQSRKAEFSKLLKTKKTKKQTKIKFYSHNIDLSRSTSTSKHSGLYIN